MRCAALVCGVGALLWVGACKPTPKVKTGDPNAPNVCVRTLNGDVDVPKQQAADILIVVDNSGSMADKQANLVANFLNTDATECPLQDLKNIPAGFKNPAPALYTAGGPLAKCGFIQLVSAFDNDFRIGVITTDVGLCDNRNAASEGGVAWGYRPQRGCLHGDGPPGSGERKIIARADLDDADTSNDDFSARFKATLDNVGTFGSPVERGLDAMNLFLDPNAVRAPECTDDLTLFRRKNASLVVIFLSDENDCSHALGGKLAVFGDEFAPPSCTVDGDCTTAGDASTCTGGVCPEVCNEYASGLTTIPGSKCYSNPEDLSSVDLYVAPLLAVDPHVKVAVIAAPPDPANLTALNGCLIGADGTPETGPAVCFESPETNGTENITQAGFPCAADTAASRNGLPCCLGDTADRYFSFAAKFPERATNSICNASFRDTMIQIAALVAAVDEVDLVSPPDDPNAIVVEVTHADGTKSDLSPIDASADCTATDGFRLEDGTHVLLCGNGRLGPGDSVAVRARGGSTSVECNAPFFEASGGGVNCASSPGAIPACGALVFAVFARRRQARRLRRR